MAHYALRFMPYSLTFSACAIYMCFVALAELVTTLLALAFGGWGVTATRGGWIIVNMAMFGASFVLAWHIVMPLVERNFNR